MTVEVSEFALNAMKQALEFYSEQANYYVQESPTHTIIDDDGGMRAKEALEHLEEEMAVSRGEVPHG